MNDAHETFIATKAMDKAIYAAAKEIYDVATADDNYSRKANEDYDEACARYNDSRIATLTAYGDAHKAALISLRKKKNIK